MMFGHSGLITAEYDIWAEYQDRQNAFLASLLDEDPTGRCGYVYLFEMIPTDGYLRDGRITFKIGCSRNPEKRLKEVRRSSVRMPYRIKAWQAIWAEDMFDAEKSLHQMLSQYRLDGEWFSLPQVIWESLTCLWYITGSRQSGGRLYYHWNRAESDTPMQFFQKAVAEYQEIISRGQRNEAEYEQYKRSQGDS